ncbi:hypothetical protein ACI782_09460 [Geodermatophilus sp. SYSU D00703]
MDSSAPAAVPWVVLGGALLALAGLVAAELRARRGGARRPAGPAPQPPPSLERPRSRFPDDDLPGFLEAPPGTPAAAVGSAPAAAPGPPPAAAGAPRAGRAVAGMAAGALVLVAALALLAAVVGGGRGPATPPAPSTPPGPPTAAPAAPTTDAPLPELPGVPSDPLPGESGAGALASRSIPLGDDGVTATLGFGGVVVEEHAVGITVGYPVVSVTAADAAARGAAAALAHVRLPTWNCMTDGAPADPEAAGCVRSRTEYADLPSPALTVTREGDDVRLTGRFPSYTRPIAAAPTYTGRVYELTVTIAPTEAVHGGRAAAEGTLFLGSDRAATVDAPGVNVVRYGG